MMGSSVAARLAMKSEMKTVHKTADSKDKSSVGRWEVLLELW